MLKRSIDEVTFAFLDTETTGISPAGGARVCELAILATRGGELVGSLETLINPQRRIDPGAQRIHGITDAMVADSPTFSSVAARVRDFLKDTAMVCHNAPFDLAFMRAEFARAGLDMPDIPIVDTLPLARKHFKFESNSLGRIAQALGVTPEGWHRAGNDVRMLKQVFDRFLAEFHVKGARTLGDLLKL